MIELTKPACAFAFGEGRKTSAARVRAINAEGISFFIIPFLIKT
jgi:hypothetical protein